MQDNVTSQRVVSAGGLNTLNNYLTLSTENPGAAVVLVNFESSKSGGYRRINGFAEYDSTYPEVGVGVAEGGILGIWLLFNTVDRHNYLIAARKDLGTDTYSIYYLDPFGTGWLKYTLPSVRNTDNVAGVQVLRVRAEIFNHGADNSIIFVDGVNNALLFDGTTFYDLVSTGAGGAGSPGGNQIINAPAVVTSFKGYILLSGDETAPAVVSYCAPLDALDWTSASGGGQAIFGNPVVQLKPFRDECFVFGLTNIKKLVPDSVATFLFQDVTTNLGCIARDSVLEVGGSLIFLSSDGIRPIAGTDKINDVELGLLSEEIQDTMDTFITNNDLRYVNGVVIRKKTQFRYFFSDDSYTTDVAEGLLGCARSHKEADSVHRWEFSNLYGIRSSACWSGMLDSTEIVVHGDYDGKIYLQESGNSFNGSDIVAIYSSPYLDMGDTEIRKQLRELVLFTKTEGTVSITLAVRFDWGRAEVQNPASYSIDVSGVAAFDDPTTLYDDAIFGGLARSVTPTPIQGTCFSVQYIFSTVDQSAPYTIHGFVTEFTPTGRQ